MYVVETRKRILSYILNVILYLITLPYRLFGPKRKVKNMQAPKILISRPDHIGDVLLSTPIYHSLKEKFPNGKIVVIVGSWAKQVVAGNPYIDEIWTIDCPWWVGIRHDVLKKDSFYQEYKALLQKIKTEQFDIFIELRGDIRHTFLFGWRAHIPMRIANDRSGGRFLVTHPVAYNFELHEMAKNYQLLQVFEPIKKYEKTELYINEDDKATFNIQQRYIVLFNGGRSPLRRLKEEKIIELVRRLHSEFNVLCIMVGGKEDADRAAEVDQAINDPKTYVSLCGKINLKAVKQLIEKAMLFIGNDSSVSHVLASTYTPAISLYGPMLPNQVMPLGAEKHVIYKKYPCSPCAQTICVVTQSPTHAQCMADITVDEIMTLTKTILA